MPGRKLGFGPLVIVLAAQVFYGWWDWRFLGLLWITIFADFFLAQRVAATTVVWQRKAYLATSFTISLSLLGFFKYWNFFVHTAVLVHLPGAHGARIASLILPVGISFYTFQSLSYIFDVYRGVHKPVKNLVEYASFVAYWPQLVAGPIHRVGQLLPQIVRPAPMTVERTIAGITLFSYGFFLKACGDAIAQLVNPTFANLNGSSQSAVVAAIFGFGLQIYFDFNGYSQMARGVSRTLGIELITNFRSPYLASSFRDFWNRWHISLSSWLRDYVYISFGGNRVSVPLRYRNLMLTMLIGGLWHGAGWNFVIWGGLQGAYLVANTAFNLSPLGRWSTKIPHALRSGLAWAITFVGVMYAWLYFRIGTFHDAVVANRKIWEWLTSGQLWDWHVPVGLGVMVGAIFLVDLIRRDAPDLVPAELAGPRRTLVSGALTGTCFAIGIILLAATPARQFIYFQF